LHLIFAKEKKCHQQIGIDLSALNLSTLDSVLYNIFSSIVKYQEGATLPL